MLPWYVQPAIKSIKANNVDTNRKVIIAVSEVVFNHEGVN